MVDEVEGDATLPLETEEDASLLETDGAEEPSSELLSQEEDEQEEPLAEQPKRSRAAERIQQEISRRKLLEEQNAFYRQQLEEQRRTQPPQYQQPRVDPAQEQAYVEQLDEASRINYYVNKATSTQNVQLQQLQLMMYVQQDKYSFDSMLASNPVLRKYSSLVEDRFNDNMQKGQPRSRQEILDAVIGAEIREKGSKVTSKAQQAGSDNVRRQTTRPYNARSSVSGSSATKNETAEQTLKRRLAEGAYNNF